MASSTSGTAPTPAGDVLTPPVTTEVRGRTLLVGLDRSARRNAFDSAMLDGLAERIATAAPRGVRATLAPAHRAVREAAAERPVPDVVALPGSADAAEGVRSFVERRAAAFTGK